MMIGTKEFIALILLVTLISSGCSFYASASEKNCKDGWGENSYFLNSNKEINVQQMRLKTPDEIVNRRVAYVTIECSKEKDFLIKENDGFKNVTQQDFFQFIKRYNLSCSGCLDVYLSGCC